MKFIGTLREGDRINEIYLCKKKQNALTKAGKSYGNLVLQDKTGMIDGKIWDPSSAGIDDFDALDYVDIMGDVTSFQGALQLNVKRVRVVHEGEYDPADYLPSSEFNLDEMYEELLEIIDSIQEEHLKGLLDSFFRGEANWVECFKTHSAAKMVHHGFRGGLLEHTLNVTRVSNFYAENYPMLNRDLLLSAAMLHDIGKTIELSALPENDYTDEGNLLGHIVMGSEMIGDHIRQMDEFPRDLELELKHCIIAHHGELEYGSPKKPALMEAVALNFADNVDAKMETMKEAFNGAQWDGGEWLPYQRLFETKVRKTTVSGK